MKELILNGSRNTSRIFIDKGLLQQAADLCLADLSTEDQPSKICMISDTNVAPVYLEVLTEQWEPRGFEVCSHIITAGEEYKTLQTVSEIYETLSRNQLGRKDMIIALGGGVIGDIAGFAAATYLRGIRHLIQIPTTLLAQVDSSVGGKCGVDLPTGKNLVGAFRQPDKVIIDMNVLSTLSREIFSSGLAEVIKYGCIWDPEILELLSADELQRNLEEIVTRCVKIKIHVVEEDETEEGLRRILNFGHTIGHAVEMLGDFTRFSHGEAVAVGMVAAVKMGEAFEITKKGTLQNLTAVLKKFDLPTDIPYNRKDLYGALLTDKKKQGDCIHFIHIEEPGKTRQVKMPVLELKEMMKVLGD
ncbi:3-dehydroquinate synthase [Sinanaerobacter chloroacetimidivorans]|uniref:3-dehydroquinate synthase n=1 Tax=Sinanaerobacter chloroacetimidivorans TaxID=2818044 RepID=A0A8J8AZP6_9FIRM|nr:3-dehydroquinate synthase [Sinanaerobacter chloroacetimidivorans]MBR0596753.1 3-dehydroquinate synthase [Sinanaerobacter chloroacetimidivorans]